MQQIEIRDNVIWAKHLKPYPSLHNRVTSLRAGETIRLAVDGIVGTWAKMDDGKDGRPTDGIKPTGAMASVWKRYQVRRGERVAISWPDDEDDLFLRLADETFEEWYSAEDEEAFGHLQPL